MLETAVSASSAAKPSATPTEASSVEIAVFYFLAKISIV